MSPTTTTTTSTPATTKTAATTTTNVSSTAKQQNIAAMSKQKQKQQSSSTNRFLSIDILRTLAIFIMVPCHFMLYLGGFNGLNDIDPSPCIFSFLNGLSYKLWLTSYIIIEKKKKTTTTSKTTTTNKSSNKKNRSSLQEIKKKATIRSIKQGLFLLVLASIHSVLKFLQFNYETWLILDILSLHGMSRIILSLIFNYPFNLLMSINIMELSSSKLTKSKTNLSKSSSSSISSLSSSSTSTTKFIPIILILLIISISPYVREIGQYHRIFHNEEETFFDMLGSLLYVGYFPILPWIVFPIVGYLVGCGLLIIDDVDDDNIVDDADVVDDDKSNKKKKKNLSCIIDYQKNYAKKLVVIGFILMLFSYLLWNVNNGKFIKFLSTTTSIPIPITGRRTRRFIHDYIGPWDKYPCTTTYISGGLGIALFLFGLLRLFVDLNSNLLLSLQSQSQSQSNTTTTSSSSSSNRKKTDDDYNNNDDKDKNKNDKIASFFVNIRNILINACMIYGRNALTIYFVHIILGVFWPRYLITYIKNGNRLDYSDDLIPERNTCLLFSFIYLISTYVFYNYYVYDGRSNDGKKSRTGLEALMHWVLSKNLNRII